MAIQILKVGLKDRSVLDPVLKRAREDLSSTLALVKPIVEDVKNRGDSALREYTQKFDEVIPPKSFVLEISKLNPKIDPKLKTALVKAAKNIRNFHKIQIPENKEIIIHGNKLGILHTPVESVSVYAPGGKALYPSTILMGVIPAKLAGVKNIQIVTPPRKGTLPDGLIAAAKIAGADRIVMAGGAQGIAAVSYGTESIPSSEFVVGPGNKFVTAAKVYLSGQGVIGIDSPAGPSEVLIIADDSADPMWVAADLLSQAEHGEDSVAILCTNSLSLAQKVKEEVEKALIERPKRGEMKRKSIKDHGKIFVFSNLEECFVFSNLFAPEHLEIQTKNFKKDLKKVKHAGSVFLGNYSPVAMGDYISGTNHILPTAGAARIYSSLGVSTFLKRVTWQEVSKKSIQNLYPHVKVLSEFEGLDEEHGHSVRIRR
ncbi:histidinol dehydrogenase [Leptospira interrogans]|uniref:Histidinol dehydrogenase n=8 Tax=Leptospira interrogans TaxID=173 RepID=A0A0E2D566_LEPIR|nr:MULTISPECIES: histidinol dehydrogenase [Leptospira]ASV07360.1 histidinol dehydrogenase [Leptospira interrogans serovar Canicola]ASV09757.1 histidinol dehydrogenase [Leptospira interrogans serovar Canicola]EJO78293.1 histidinol dehydrogenase [Leptospira interrogans serovar Pomona str. Kennewicki LC82-25]EKN98010.1 histidinol dehydrogenase [Leptospira interrogans serovar Pomona str. Pomona]EKO70368.1 histidinol dehydrogenase [Leptospira interrogans serovar Canicola str. Fiocruz LV133]